jgi:hypothetical protein
MHRVDASGNVANKFTNGNPQIGQLATALEQDWHNSVQEEICKVIEQAGIALEKGNDAQLYAAIVALVAGSVGTGGASVPTTRQVLGSGLVTGGGPLATDVTLNVPKASAAEVLAGVLDSKAVTPLGMAGAFPRLLAANGYITLPFGGGMMLQWLSGTAAANTTTILNLPTSFPSACFGALCNGGRLSNDSSDNPPFISGYGTSNISIFNDINTATNVFAVALGN